MQNYTLHLQFQDNGIAGAGGAAEGGGATGNQQAPANRPGK